MSKKKESNHPKKTKTKWMSYDFVEFSNNPNLIGVAILETAEIVYNELGKGEFVKIRLAADLVRNRWSLVDNNGIFLARNYKLHIANPAVQAAMRTLPLPNEFCYLELFNHFMHDGGNDRNVAFEPFRDNNTSFFKYIEGICLQYPDLYPNLPVLDGTPMPFRTLKSDICIPAEEQWLKAIGEHVEYVRKNILHMTQREFADKAGLTQPQVSSLEKGKWNISVASLMTIAAIFNVSLLPLTEKENLEGKYLWMLSKDGETFDRYLIIGKNNIAAPFNSLFAAPVKEDRYLKLDSSGEELEYKNDSADYNKIIAVGRSHITPSRKFPGEYIYNVSPGRGDSKVKD